MSPTLASRRKSRSSSTRSVVAVRDDRSTHAAVGERVAERADLGAEQQRLVEATQRDETEVEDLAERRHRPGPPGELLRSRRAVVAFAGVGHRRRRLVGVGHRSGQQVLGQLIGGTIDLERSGRDVGRVAELVGVAGSRGAGDERQRRERCALGARAGVERRIAVGGGGPRGDGAHRQVRDGGAVEEALEVRGVHVVEIGPGERRHREHQQALCGPERGLGGRRLALGRPGAHG